MPTTITIATASLLSYFVLEDRLVRKLPKAKEKKVARKVILTRFALLRIWVNLPSA